MDDRYFVFDVECIPNPDMDEWIKKYIELRIENKRGANKNADRYAAITPELSMLVCIGLYDSVVDEDYILAGTEKQILQSFYDFYKDRTDRKLVSFNGKRFDAVHINKRSCINNTNNYELSIPNKRYDKIYHYDLLEILTNNYTDEYHSLHTYCKLYGIEVSDMHDGSDIYELYKSERFEEIFAHCRSDVILTAKLYEKIKNYL